MKNVLAIAGSLRRDSLNRQLLRAAADLVPSGMTIDVYDELSSIPLFDEDLEQQATIGSVARLRGLVASAGGLLIATPEYNWSIPGVLKNAIDWLSRPAPAEVLIGKPIAIIGASSGRWGTRLAQSHLRQVLTATESLVMPAPALFVRDGVIDASTQKQLAALLDAFARWIEMVPKGVAHV
jgi:chromate reductase